MLNFQETLITPEKFNEIFLGFLRIANGRHMKSNCDNNNNIACLSHSLSSEERNYGILKRQSGQSHANTCVIKEEENLPWSLRILVAFRSLTICAPCFPPLQRANLRIFPSSAKKVKYILHIYTGTNCRQHFPVLIYALNCLLDGKMTRKESVEPSKNVTC